MTPISEIRLVGTLVKNMVLCNSLRYFFPFKILIFLIIHTYTHLSVSGLGVNLQTNELISILFQGLGIDSLYLGPGGGKSFISHHLHKSACRNYEGLQVHKKQYFL